jgi:hypothetical protein
MSAIPAGTSEGRTTALQLGGIVQWADKRDSLQQVREEAGASFPRGVVHYMCLGRYNAFELGGAAIGSLSCHLHSDVSQNILHQARRNAHGLASSVYVCSRAAAVREAFLVGHPDADALQDP